MFFAACGEEKEREREDREGGTYSFLRVVAVFYPSVIPLTNDAIKGALTYNFL